MPLNRDDVQGRLKKRPPVHAAALAQAHAIRAARAEVPSLQPIATNPEKPVRRYEPAYKGEKPAGHEAVGTPSATRGTHRKLRPYYSVTPDHRSGLERAVDRDVTPMLAAAPKLASPALTRPANVAGNVLAQLSGGPALVSAVEHARKGEALPAAAELASLLPVGRFGKAAKAAKEAVAAEKALPAGAKELRDALAGKTPNMGQYEKIGAKLDDPNLGKSAAALRKEQDQLGSVERAKRVHEAERIYTEAISAGHAPEEAHRLSGKALAGELPKLKFTAGSELSADNLPGLFQHITEHPAFRPFERRRTRQALLNLFAGKTLQNSEIKLLGVAFGEEDAQALAGSAPLWKELGRQGLDVLNLPRALKSSLDMSAMFRQALVLGARHPRMFASEIKPAMKAMFSENAYKDVQDYIVTHPDFDKAVKSRVSFTDLGDTIAQREEAFATRFSNMIPGVRMSARNYAAFLNRFRMDAFSNYLKIAEKSGVELTEKDLTDIASWVNNATGRGSIKALEGAMVPLQTLLFSPRLIASRLNLLNPVYYARLDPFTRKQALRGMGQLLAGLGLTLYMAKLGGAEVGVDPRSANFAKIKVGNTRIDLGGGFQQYIVAAARLVKGEMVSSTTGEVEKLAGGYGKPSRADIMLNFAEGKLAPVPRFFDQWARNENDDLKPFHPLRELPLLFAPLGAEQTVQTYQRNGVRPAIAAGVLGTVGFGVQTYGPKADADYKKNLKIIDAAVKTGQLTQTDANAAKKDLERVHYLQTHDSKENRRQFVIDEMKAQGSDSAEINATLKELHYEGLK